jgi:hypothetical protein
MIALLCFVLAVLASPFKSKGRLEAENAALRHQVVVLRRMVHKRVRLTNSDRWLFIQLYRWFPSVLKVITVIRPETSSVGIGLTFVGYPFRKRYPEIDLDYTRFKFPVLAFNFPVPSQKFPVPLSREFCSKSAESLDEWRPLSRELAQN